MSEGLLLTATTCNRFVSANTHFPHQQTFREVGRDAGGWVGIFCSRFASVFLFFVWGGGGGGGGVQSKSEDFEKDYIDEAVWVCLSVYLSLASDSSETFEVIIISKLGTVTDCHRHDYASRACSLY